MVSITQRKLVAGGAGRVKPGRNMPMQARLIAGRLALAGLKHIDIAEKLDVCRSHISNLIRGHERNPRLQRKIAALLGVGPEEFWGEFLHPSLRRGGGRRS